MKEFIATVKVTYRTTVMVVADDAEGAKAKFDEGDWEDDGMDGAERIDWTDISLDQIKEIK